MKNIKVDNKGKRLLSTLVAGMLMATPALANADGNNNENTGFTLVKQEMKVDGYDLNIDNYTGKLEYSYNYLKQFIDYDYLQADLQILYYISNRPYMSTETNDELIARGVVFSEDYIKENFHRAFGLIYRINEYNTTTIRNDYLNGTMDINHLIDPSILCFDAHDQKIVRSMFENYFNAYQSGLFDNADYTAVFKELTTLNAEERQHNAFSSETGAMWLSQMTIGRQVIEMLHDDMLRDFTMDELSVYFVREELEQGNWVLREDAPSFDLNCMSHLEDEIFNLGELETFCYDLVNNNIYKIFNINDNVETENETENYASEENTEVVEATVVENNEVVETETVETAVVENATVSEADCSYGECVTTACEYLSGKINYDHLPADLKCLVFLTNREYLTEDEQNDLISQGIVYETNFETEEGLQNFMQAYSLINIILDYNQSVIREDYENNTMSLDHLIDPSCLCMNATDREIVHNMHVTYFEAYKAGRFENNYYYAVLAELVGNTNISFGPMWMARNIVGGDVMQMLRDDMQADFERKDLDKFFDKKELNAGQWILRGDAKLDINSSDELTREASNFNALWPYVYDDVNNDLFASFQVNCK